MDPSQAELFYIGKTHRRRELRLVQHVEVALSGIDRPVSEKLRNLVQHGVSPEIFVLERVPGSASWDEAERRQIAFWKSLDVAYFPVLWPPMTPKSSPTVITRVDLKNAR